MYDEVSVSMSNNCVISYVGCRTARPESMYVIV